MSNLKDAIMNLFEDYKNVFLREYAEERNVCLAIDDDLSDKGFSKDEIVEILYNQMSENTLYKLGAYMIALFNEPETLEEWKISIKNDAEMTLSEEECIKLWTKYQELDY